MDNPADDVSSTRRQLRRKHERFSRTSECATSSKEKEGYRPLRCAFSRRNCNTEEKKFIVEGKVRIQGAEHNEVFYNPVQVFNRDLSIIAIKAFAEMQKDEIHRRGERALDRAQSEGKPAVTPLKFVGFNVVEPLAATGLRSLRYLVELEGVVNSVVANDMDPHAVGTMKENAAINGVSLAKLHVTCTEATRLLYGLAFPANISHGTLKKLYSLPAGSSIPDTFDLSPLYPTVPLVPLSHYLDEEACRQTVLHQQQQQQKMKQRTQTPEMEEQKQKDAEEEEQQEKEKQQGPRHTSGTGDSTVAAQSSFSPSSNPLLSAEPQRVAPTPVAVAAASSASLFESALNSASSQAAAPREPAVATAVLRKQAAAAPQTAAAAQAAAVQEEAATGGGASTAAEAAGGAASARAREEGQPFFDLPVCFDVVDIDPYGSVTPFLDAAIQAVRPGGLLCLTSTDMPVLCGNSPETTFYKYGGAAVKAKYIHEMALRLIVYAACSSAAKYKKVVVPLLSCSVDFYVRVFVKIFDSAEGCRDFHSQAAIVQQCVACDAFRVLALGSVSGAAAAGGKGTAATAGATTAEGEGETAGAAAGEGESTLASGGGGGAKAPGDAAAGEVGRQQKEEGRQESEQQQQDHCCPGDRKQQHAGPDERQEGENEEYEDAEKRQKDRECLAETSKRCGTEGKSRNAMREEGRRNLASNKRKVACFPADMTGCCCECGQRTMIGGPFYAGPLYNQEFVEKCLKLCASAKDQLPGITMGTRITGLLTAIQQELHDVPLFYHLPSLCQKMRLEMLRPSAVRAALVRLGYKVSHFHRDPQAIKTNASSTVVFDILRTHAKRHPPARGAAVPLLMKEITTKGIDMTRLPPSDDASRNVPRWLPNPTPHWGPKSRASSKKPYFYFVFAKWLRRMATWENGHAAGEEQTFPCSDSCAS